MVHKALCHSKHFLVFFLGLYGFSFVIGVLSIIDRLREYNARFSKSHRTSVYVLYGRFDLSRVPNKKRFNIEVSFYTIP